MDSNAAFVRELYTAFAEGQIDRVLEGCADDVAWESVGDPAYVPHGGRYFGRQGAANFFENLERAYTFQIFSPDELYAVEDRVFCLGRTEATSNVTGRVFANRCVHVFRIRDGRVAEFIVFDDTAGVAVTAGTLGPVPEAARGAA